MTSLWFLTAMHFQEDFRVEWKQEETLLAIQQWQIWLTILKSINFILNWGRNTHNNLTGGKRRDYVGVIGHSTSLNAKMHAGH